MSTEQSLDPELIEQTKQQIRSLVGEIAQLTKEDLTPEEFYGQFLKRVVDALAAIGGAVWTVNDEGRLALQHYINLDRTNLRDNEQGQMQHSRLLYKALQAPEGMIVPPHSGSGEDNEAGNPTDLLLVLGALKTDLEVAGVLEVFQRPEPGPATQRGYLRFVLQMCELAADFLKSHQLRRFSDRQILWTQLEEFTRTVHASLNPRETAYTIANEGRRLIECDRVSVAIRKGKHCHIEAVSGQDVFDKRSNTVRLLGKLASAVVATGDPIWYAGDTRDMAPQVEDAVQEYIDESHSKNVAVLPLRRPKPAEEEDPNKREEPEPPVGALIVEQIEDSRVPQSMVQRVEVVCRHSSAAMANALEHQNLFLMPVWRTLGQSRWIVQARTLPKTLSIAGGILVLLLFLAVFPKDFEVYSKGALEPRERHKVFAGVDGTVDKLWVHMGDKVRKGQRLAELRNPDLEVQYKDIVGKLSTTEKQILALRRALSDAKQLRSEEQVRLAGDEARLRQEKETYKSQKESYDDKLKELQVLSPIDGVVVTSDLENLLRSRPVQRGQELMRVADPKGPWQLELRMPESRMGYVRAAQNALQTDLPVRYQMATHPGTTFEGKVDEVAPSAEVHGTEGSAVLIKVSIDKEELMERYGEEGIYPGAEVNGKVYCGRRPIGYVWFHDLVAFIQARVLFRFF